MGSVAWEAIIKINNGLSHKMNHQADSYNYYDGLIYTFSSD